MQHQWQDYFSPPPYSSQTNHNREKPLLLWITWAVWVEWEAWAAWVVWAAWVAWVAWVIGDNMPTYAYICRKCNAKFDRFQRISDEPVKECEQCHAEAVERLPSAGVGLHFQGSGFYCTDYNTKPSEGASGLTDVTDRDNKDAKDNRDVDTSSLSL